MPKHDMSQEFDDNNYAVYLPAISGFYTGTLAKVTEKPETARATGAPKGFEFGFEGLDFLKAEDNYYRYRYGLYSAGHAQLDMSKAVKDCPMVHNRPEDTVIVGDSGGFQLATGVIKMDWSTAKDVNDPAREKLCAKILTWLEETCDWSMTLDVPALAAAPPLDKKTGLTKFQDTLDITVLNLDYFIKHRRPEKTKLLNVISGSSASSVGPWYDAVIKYSDPKEIAKMGYDDPEERAMEGFGFGGCVALNISSTLDVILRLIEDDLLHKTGWIHVLGIGRIDYACYLTSLQRALNKELAPNLKISYDAASPFVGTAYGQYYGVSTFDKKRVGYNMGKAPDNKRLAFSTASMPWDSPVMNRCTVQDICVKKPAHAIVNGEILFAQESKSKDKAKFTAETEQYAIELEDQVQELNNAGVDAKFVPADLNRNDKETKTSWDIGSYMIMMGHNVYMHIDAVRQALRLSTIEQETHKGVSWLDWNPGRGKSANVNNFAEYVPGSVIYFESLMGDLFAPGLSNDERRAIYNDALPFLQTLNARNMTTNPLFDGLFSDSEPAGNDVEDKFASLDDDKMTDLEQNLDKI